MSWIRNKNSSLNKRRVNFLSNFRVNRILNGGLVSILNIEFTK